MITTNIDTLKINELTEKQYTKALKEGRINDDEFYLTVDNNEYTLSFTADEINRKLSIISTPDDPVPSYIDPVFANNSWETISWVAKNDDPSKYWKVGDWKLLDYPRVARPGKITNATTTQPVFFFKGGNSRPYTGRLGYMQIVDSKKFTRVINEYVVKNDMYELKGTSSYYRIFSEFSYPNEPTNTSSNPKVYLGVAAGPSTGTVDFRITESMELEELLDLLGIEFHKEDAWYQYATTEDLNKFGLHVYAGWFYSGSVIYEEKQYPVMILGFNHDYVTDVASYGKQKAGMTLCLGVSRGANGLENVPPYEWEHAMQPNLYESGVSQFDSSHNDDTMASPYYKGDGTNWGECTFRETLQTLLEGTQLDTKIVAVDKRTAKGKFKPEINYYSSVISSDKISLLSEYETHGMVKCSCAQEGDWYEFFKQGKSRFFWDSRMLNKQASKLYLWSRSPWNKDQSTDPLYVKGGCILLCTDTLKINSYESDINTTISNATAACKCIREASDELVNQYRDFDIIFNFSVNSSDIASPIALVISGNNNYYYNIPNVRIPTAGNPSWSNFIADMKNLGFTIDANEIAGYSYDTLNLNIIKVSMTHSDSQVGYMPNAWGNGATGTLLPIFCL